MLRILKKSCGGVLNGLPKSSNASTAVKSPRMDKRKYLMLDINEVTEREKQCQCDNSQVEASIKKMCSSCHKIAKNQVYILQQTLQGCFVM